jgi:hypothetical protein
VFRRLDQNVLKAHLEERTASGMLVFGSQMEDSCVLRWLALGLLSQMMQDPSGFLFLSFQRDQAVLAHTDHELTSQLAAYFPEREDVGSALSHMHPMAKVLRRADVLRAPFPDLRLAGTRSTLCPRARGLVRFAGQRVLDAHSPGSACSRHRGA